MNADDSHLYQILISILISIMCVCTEKLQDGGAGFIEHIDFAENCTAEFEDWLETISGDIGGE